MPQTKALSGLKITDPSEGRVQAVFATFNTVDHDNDVTLPGAFEDGAKVRISAYNHASWGPAMLPVGKGTISQTDREAILDGQFFMNTQAGRETFETVKELDDLGEWSYGYDIVDGGPGVFDGEEVNYLKKLKTHEVSPVLLGAGIGTRTIATKGKQLDSDLHRRLDEAGTNRYGEGPDTYCYVVDFDPDEGYVIYCVYGPDQDRTLQVTFSRNGDEVVLQPGDREVERSVSYEPKASEPEGTKDGEPDGAETPAGEADPAAKAKDEEPGLKLSDHLAAVTATVGEVADRLAEVMAMRADEGKALGEQSRTNAGELADSLDALAKELREVVTSAAAQPPAPNDRRLTLEDETALAETRARLSL
jgi:hypothetical protein